MTTDDDSILDEDPNVNDDSDGDVLDERPEQPDEAAATAPDADDVVSDGEAPEDSGEPVEPDDDSSLTTDDEAPPARSEQDKRSPDDKAQDGQDQPDLDQMRQELEQLRRDRAEFQTQFQKKNEELKKYQDIDPEVVREYKSRQEAARLQDLPPWNALSPQHQEYRQSIDRVRQVQQQIQEIQGDPDLSPEQKEQRIRQKEASLSEQDVSYVESHRNHVQAINEAMYSSPDFAHMVTNTMDFFSRVFEHHMTEYQKRQQAQQSVEGWFKENPELVDKYIDQINDRHQAGWSFPAIKDHIELLAERDGLHSRQSELEKKASAASERDRLRKKESRIDVDPSTADLPPDIDKIVQQRRSSGEYGIDELDVLAELEESSSGQEV